MIEDYTTYEKVSKFLQRETNKRKMERIKDCAIDGIVGVKMSDCCSVSAVGDIAKEMFYGLQVPLITEFGDKTTGTPKFDTMGTTNFVRLDRKMLMNYLTHLNSEWIYLAIIDECPARFMGEIDGVTASCIVAPAIYDFHTEYSDLKKSKEQGVKE